MNEYQSVLNALMISELRKLKEEQSKLNEAVLSLKLDSLKLESKVDNQFNGVRTQNSYLLTSVYQVTMKLIFRWSKTNGCL